MQAEFELTLEVERAGLLGLYVGIAACRRCSQRSVAQLIQWRVAPLRRSRVVLSFDRSCEHLPPSLCHRPHASSPAFHHAFILSPPNSTLPPPPPCCNCHTQHAKSNKSGYLSCLNEKTGRVLAGCACNGACPPRRCEFEECVECVRSRKIGDLGEQDKDWQVQRRRGYNTRAQRNRQLSPSAHTIPVSAAPIQQTTQEEKTTTLSVQHSNPFQPLALSGPHSGEQKRQRRPGATFKADAEAEPWTRGDGAE